MAFTVRRRTTLSPQAAWAALTDLAEHTRHVPLTDLEVPAGGLWSAPRSSPGPGSAPSASPTACSSRPSSRAGGCAW